MLILIKTSKYHCFSIVFKSKKLTVLYLCFKDEFYKILKKVIPGIVAHVFTISFHIYLLYNLWSKFFHFRIFLWLRSYIFCRFSFGLQISFVLTTLFSIFNVCSKLLHLHKQHLYIFNHKGWLFIEIHFSQRM